MWFLIKDLDYEITNDPRPTVMFVEAQDYVQAGERAVQECPWLMGWNTEMIDNLITVVAHYRALRGPSHAFFIYPLPSTPEASLRALYRLTDG